MIPKITKVNASRLLKKATEVHWWWWCISFSFEICCVRPRDDLLPGRQWARGPPSCSPTLRCPWKQSPCSILPLHRPGTGAPGVGLTKSVVVLFSTGEHPKESVYVSDEQTRIKCCSTPVALGAEQGHCEPSKGFVSKSGEWESQREIPRRASMKMACIALWACSAGEDRCRMQMHTLVKNYFKWVVQLSDCRHAQWSQGAFLVIELDHLWE